MRAKREYFRKQQEARERAQREYASKEEEAAAAMQLAAKNFLIFSGITFFLFGLFSNDNKYSASSHHGGNGWLQFTSDSHLSTYSGLSKLAMRHNGLSQPVVDTRLAERVSQTLKNEKPPDGES